jgi:hypothetical protein
VTHRTPPVQVGVAAANAHAATTSLDFALAPTAQWRQKRPPIGRSRGQAHGSQRRGVGVECGLRPSAKHAGGRAHGERSVAEALQRIKEGRDARSSTTQAVAHGTVNVMVTTWHLTTMRRRKRTDGPVRLYSFHTPRAPSIERCIALRCVALPCLHKSDGVEHRQQPRILFVRMRASAELPRRARAERVHFS